MAAIGSLVVRILGDTSDLRKGLAEARGSLRKTGRVLNNMGEGIARNITLPLLGASAVGLKLAANIDESFSHIENLVGITGDKLEHFKDGVKSLSGEVGRSQAELAKALFVVTSAGIRDQARAMGVLEAAAKGSVIGLGDVKDVARAVTGVMQAYGESNLSAARATDIFAAIIKEGNLEADKLAPILGRVTGVASQVGVSLEEVGAQIATFTRLGVNVEEAVTGIRGIMNAFLKGGDQAEKTLKKLGHRLKGTVLDGVDTFQGLRDAIADPQIGLTEVLITLSEATEGNEAALAKLFPNVRALSAIMGTAGSQSETLRANLESIKRSADLVAIGFSKARDTIQQRFNRSLVNLQNASIELGRQLLPTFEKITDAVTQMAQVFTEMDEATHKSIVTWGLWSAAIAAGLLTMGKIITSAQAVAAALWAIVPVAKAAGAAITGWQIAISATKLGALLAVIAGGIWLWDKWKEKVEDAETAQNLYTRAVADFARKGHPILEKNVDIIQDLEASDEDRKKAIEALQKAFPGYFKDLKVEWGLISAVRDEYGKLNKILTQEEGQKAVEDKIKAMEKRLFDLTNTLFNLRMLYGDGSNLSPRDPASKAVIIQMEDLEKAIEKTRTTLGDLKSDLKDLEEKGTKGNDNDIFGIPDPEDTYNDPDPPAKKIFILKDAIKEAMHSFLAWGDVQKLTSDLTSAYGQEVEKLREKGLGPLSKEVQDNVKKLAAWQELLKLSDLKEGGELLKEFTKRVYDLADEVSDDMWFRSIRNILTDFASRVDPVSVPIEIELPKLDIPTNVFDEYRKQLKILQEEFRLTGDKAEFIDGRFGMILSTMKKLIKEGQPLGEVFNLDEVLETYSANLERLEGETTSMSERMELAWAATMDALSMHTLPEAGALETLIMEYFRLIAAFEQTPEGTAEKWEKEMSNWAEKLEKFADVAGQVTGSIMNVWDAALDKRAQQLENAEAKELAALEKMSINEEAKEKKKLEIQEKYEKKSRALRRRQAKADKAAAMFSAIINTASAVTTALNTKPFQLGLVLAGIASTMGLAQVATIASTPLPALAMGGLAYGPTTAIVGDNPNARVDPEVIAPLSKLQKMIGGVGKDMHITFSEPRWDGEEMVMGIEKVQFTREAHRGY